MNYVHVSEKLLETARFTFRHLHSSYRYEDLSTEPGHLLLDQFRQMQEPRRQQVRDAGAQYMPHPAGEYYRKPYLLRPSRQMSLPMLWVIPTSHELNDTHEGRCSVTL